MTNEYDFLKRQRYEYYKGTKEIIDNEVNEIIEDVVDVLNQKDYNINELLEIKQFQAERIAELSLTEKALELACATLYDINFQLYNTEMDFATYYKEKAEKELKDE